MLATFGGYIQRTFKIENEFLSNVIFAKVNYLNTERLKPGVELWQMNKGYIQLKTIKSALLKGLTKEIFGEIFSGLS